MKKLPVTILFLLISFTISSQQFVDSETPVNTNPVNNDIGTGWILDFSDEFNGTSVNENKWNVDNSPNTRNPRPDIKVSKWFWRPQNVEVKNGNLILKVKKENNTTMYCGSINSKGKYMSRYGYYETRIQVADINKGTHTAFWFQGPNQGNIDGTGNDGAEIDVFESAFLSDSVKVLSHCDGYGSLRTGAGARYVAENIHHGFHTWGLWWTKDFIRVYYDGVFKAEISDVRYIPWVEEWLWLSDGASFGVQGDRFFVDQPLGWLTEAYVDYIRVWKKEPELVAGNNSLMNGGFTDGGDFWRDYGGVNFEINTATNINGRTCRMPGVNQSRIIMQDVKVTPGSKYRLSVKARIQNAAGPSGSDVNNHVDRGPGTFRACVLDQNYDTLLELITQDPTNQNLSGDVIIPQHLTNVTIMLAKTWNAAYVDDVFFEEVLESSIEETNTSNCNKITSFNRTLYLNDCSNAMSIDIYDLAGRTITHKNIMQIDADATLHVNAPGIYVAKINLVGQRSVYQKIIVQ